MNTYQTVYGDSINAQQLVAECRDQLNQLTDSACGTQMHRRAVIGKTISAHAEARHGGFNPGYTVGIRVTGQYTNQASRSLRTRADSEALAEEINTYLTEQGNIGIAS